MSGYLKDYLVGEMLPDGFGDNKHVEHFSPEEAAISYVKQKADPDLSWIEPDGDGSEIVVQAPNGEVHAFVVEVKVRTVRLAYVAGKPERKHEEELKKAWEGRHAE